MPIKKSRTEKILAGDDRIDATVMNAQLTPIHDAAAFNASFAWEKAPGLPNYIVDYVNAYLDDDENTIRDNPVLPQGDNVPGTVRWQIDAGWTQDVSDKSAQYPDGKITYGFFNHMHALGLNNNPAYGEGFGYSPFSEAQKAAARIAVQNWDDLIAPEFVEVAPSRGAKDWAQKNVDIWLANTYTGPAQAWAYYPGYPQPNERVAGDVWIADPRVNGSNAQLLPGFYGLQTLNHELGHSIGLSHPGTYDFGDDLDGDGQPDPITYTGDAQYFQDSNQFSIMSYFGSEETGAQPVDWNTLRYVYPSTPMVDDVFVAQQKYGVETSTRSGDSVYGFKWSSDVKNAAMQFKDTVEMATVFTIWDAGGTDTLNLSGYYTPSVIDLREGAYSSAGGWGSYNPTQLAEDPAAIGATAALAYINANNAAAGLGSRTATGLTKTLYGEDYFYKLYFQGGIAAKNPDGTLVKDEDGNQVYLNEGLSWKQITGTGSQYLMEQNIGIAYGALIENAIGGHGDDRINGNQANNQFTGNGGADTFIFADYSGELPDPTNANGDWYKTVVDTSVDTVMDFQTGSDKIDLTFFGSELDYADLHINTVGTTNTISFDRNADGTDDFTFVIKGAVVESDFIFG